MAASSPDQGKYDASSLPADILIAIFLNLPRNTLRCQLNITQVSRHWRSVATETPSLWDHIPEQACRQPEALEAYVRNSGSMSLHMNANFLSTKALGHPIPMQISNETVLSMCDAAPRIRNLVLQATSSSISCVLDTLLANAYKLESLTLVAGDRVSNSLEVPIRLEHFTKPLPRLVCLKIHQLPMAIWQNYLFVNLTELQITGLGTNRPPTLEDMLACLSSCSQTLQHVSLLHCLPETTSNQNNKVALSRLSRLQITDNLSRCTQLISHLSMPAEAKIGIRAHNATIDRYRRLNLNMDPLVFNLHAHLVCGGYARQLQVRRSSRDDGRQGARVELRANSPAGGHVWLSFDEKTDRHYEAFMALVTRHFVWAAIEMLDFQSAGGRQDSTEADDFFANIHRNTATGDIPLRIIAMAGEMATVETLCGMTHLSLRCTALGALHFREVNLSRLLRRHDDFLHPLALVLGAFPIECIYLCDCEGVEAFLALGALHISRPIVVSIIRCTEGKFCEVQRWLMKANTPVATRVISDFPQPSS